MIKRTLYFGNPAYLSMSNKQLVVKLPEVEKNDSLPDTFKNESVKTIPIEDIGVMILDHKQITITHGLIETLLANSTAVITCDSSRMPVGLWICHSTGSNSTRIGWKRAVTHFRNSSSQPLQCLLSCRRCYGTLSAFCR